MRVVDTVLFDLDDTLHDDTSAYRQAARRVADEVAADGTVDATRLFTAYVAEANAFWKKLSAEHLSAPIHDARVQLWYEALSAAGAPDTALAAACAERYTRYRADALQLAPGALDLVAALRARGCRLGIVTNGFASTHHAKIDRLGLRSYVDAVFLADEMGMVKPDPRIFVHACRTLGSEPARTAMVGDRYDRDVAGARSAGLFTILVDVHAIPIPEGAPPPDATVPRIADVFAALPLAGSQGAAAGAPKRSQG